MNLPRRAKLVSALAMLAIGPVAGGLIRGLPSAFFEFPPLTRYVTHAPFSWPLFGVFAVLAALALGILLWPRWFGFAAPSCPPNPETGNRGFPRWGAFGILLNIASWICIWGRFEWLGVLKDHLFFPLWLGYILVMDALVHRRTGNSLLSRAPRLFVALFPASAVSWWYFEYLNRFVQNWWYDGIEGYSGLHYGVFATLCFSTVLPAVLETAEWLASFAWFRANYTGGPKWTPRPSTAHGFTVAGTLILALMAIWPNPLFFLTWVAPLAVLAGALAAAGIENPFSDACAGDYRRIATLAAATLICGFFWEMWNFWSLPKWHYSIPYVNRFLVFEMPITGYAGYLPFGPICWCFWKVIEGAFATPTDAAAILPRPTPCSTPDRQA